MYNFYNKYISNRGDEMKHLLPSLENFIEKDFEFVQSHEIPNNLTQNLPSTRYFLLQTNHHYFISATSRPLQWKQTISINSDSNWLEVVSYLSKHETILCENDHEEIVGYLRGATILSTIFTCYQYLLAYFETVLKTVDIALSLIDEEEKVIIWTEGAEQIFSIPKESIIGKPATDFFAVEMLQALETLRTGKSVVKRQHQPREDLFVLINSNPVILQEKVIGAVSAEKDITSEIRLLQELFHMSSKVEQLHSNLIPKDDPFIKIKGNSQVMRNCKATVKKISLTKATVLISGESGTGKELFARAIHDCSHQREEPFIAINCGAIPPTLYESELFGYEGGAFTGADPKGKKGKFELASNGTLFLDEIAEMPLDMQVKLLRVLQEKSFFRVGGTKLFKVNCRIIAATNRNLLDMLKKQTFREDLYYRLNVLSLEIPPLRERKEDVFELIQYLLHEFSLLYNSPIQSFPSEVLQWLIQYNWPGNVRELRNTIERLVILSTDGIIQLEHLPASIYPSTTPNFHSQQTTLQEKIDRYEKLLLLEALQMENGNKSALAKRLGLSRATLYNKMKRLGI